jgi:hypothetical protein
MIQFFTKIISFFLEEPDIKKMGFLTSFFRTTPDSFTDSAFVEYDVVRSGAEIAPVVRNLGTGAVTIIEDEFTNKQIPFPVISLDAPVQVDSLMSRQPGENAYEEQKANWAGKIARILVRRFAKMTRMIRGTIELQAAQVLQTGTITLTDENGQPTFELDFKPKATHFPDVAVPWGTSGAKPLDDIRAVMKAIRQDGHCDVKTAIFGEDAWDKFFQDPEVRELVKQDNLAMGGLSPALQNLGAGYMGYIFIGPYRLDLMVYDAFYTPWGTTDNVNFLDPNKVILMPAISDLDFIRMFGGIPTVKVDPVFDPILGNKIPIDNEYDFKGRVYFDEPRNTYVGEIKSRPFLLPRSIDRYGCITVADLH